ncbi:MAG: SRPBCC family protein [Thermoflexales bacterium]
MPKRSNPLQPLLSALSFAGAALGAYVLWLRPWHLRWGATDTEVLTWLPGDDLIERPKLSVTHAITIRAPVEEVWPWLVQIGQGRGGFYSYSWVEGLLGLDMRSARRVNPAWQNLHAADSVPLSPDGAVALPVDIVMPNRVLVMHTDQPASRHRAVMLPSFYSSLTWGFHLRPIDAQTTRLIERFHADWPPSLWRTVLIRLLFEPGAFLMQRRMLLGIRDRAERAWSNKKQAHHPHTPSLLDAVMPDYEFCDSADVLIHAPPEVVFRAISELSSEDRPLVHMLGELRNLPAQLGNGHQHRTQDPFLSVLLDAGRSTVLLAERPNQEMVFGAAGKLHDLIDQELASLRTLEEFMAFERPNCEKLAIGLRLVPELSNGCPSTLLILEHRTHVLSAEAGRKFAAYWLGARPLGMLAMREFLSALKRRAEALARENQRT